MYAILEKTTVFFDDPTSFVVSTPNNLYNTQKIKYDWADLHFAVEYEHNVGNIKKTLFESKSDINSILKDLKTLHSKTLDTQHTNLYYSILRVWTSGMDYLSPEKMMFRGCSLNLIFLPFHSFLCLNF